jgi:hypothetical protein
MFLALGDKIQVRAHDTPHKTGVALELTRSTFTGENVTLCFNRLFLKNALQFGCLNFAIDTEAKAPAVCTGIEKTFVFMPLESKEPEAEHIDVITAPAYPTVATAVKETVPVEPAPVKRRRRRTTSVKPDAAKPVGKVALLETAEQIRQDLRNSLVQVNSLVKEIKAQRQQDRLLRNTMDNLRKLSL